ncbi:MAG: OB-fold nucleic acid binding domain-containing protein, partial [Christensenellaceae bacterium]
MAEQENIDQQELSEILRVRREKLESLKSDGQDPYQITFFDKKNSSVEIIEKFDDFEGKEVSVAGRIISKRVMGKASFFHILDGHGKIQVYARKDVMGE